MPIMKRLKSVMFPVTSLSIKEQQKIFEIMKWDEPAPVTHVLIELRCLVGKE